MILLVVLGHFIDYYTDHNVNMRRLYIFISFFHMPAFIFVSGLFSKKIVKEKRWNKLFEYFVMYVFIKVILFAADRINGGGRKFWLFAADGVEWYAFAILVFLLITILVQNYRPGYIFILALCIGCLSGYHAYNGDIFVIQRIMVFFPFFYLGYMLDADKIQKFVSHVCWRILSCVLVVTVIVVIYKYIDIIYKIRPLLTGRNPYSKLGELENWGGLLRAGYYGAVILFIFSLIALTPTIKCVVSKWGSNTLAVYVLHRVVIYFFMGLAGGAVFIEKYAPYHPGVVLIPAAVITTIFFALPFWQRLLTPILKPKYKRIEH